MRKKNRNLGDLIYSTEHQIALRSALKHAQMRRSHCAHKWFKVFHLFQLKKKIEKIQRQQERNQTDLDRLKRFDKKVRDEFFVNDRLQAEVAELQAENEASKDIQRDNFINMQKFKSVAKEFVNMTSKN